MPRSPWPIRMSFAREIRTRRNRSSMSVPLDAVIIPNPEALQSEVLSPQ